MTNRWGRRRLAQGAPIMSETSRIVGTVFQVVYGLTTPATVLAILIVTLLGALGVVDMDWVVTEERAALAYMVAFGTFALSPLVAVGLVAVGLFNAIGVIAIATGSARGVIAISGENSTGLIAISASGRASGILVGIGDEARGLFTVAYSGKNGQGVRALASVLRRRVFGRLIRCA